MQSLKAEREKVVAQSSRFCKRIGSTVYSVGVYFKEGAKETLEEKILRMMKSDLASELACGIMVKPQAETPPERGSL